jgi:hypothetical protein
LTLRQILQFPFLPVTLIQSQVSVAGVLTGGRQ